MEILFSHGDFRDCFTVMVRMFWRRMMRKRSSFVPLLLRFHVCVLWRDSLQNSKVNVNMCLFMVAWISGHLSTVFLNNYSVLTISVLPYRCRKYRSTRRLFFKEIPEIDLAVFCGLTHPCPLTLRCLLLVTCFIPFFVSQFTYTSDFHDDMC